MNLVQHIRESKQREDGFTLVELMVVVLIIGILAAIAIPIFLNQQAASIKSTVESDVRNTVTNIETWKAGAPQTSQRAIAERTVEGPGTATPAGEYAVVISDDNTTIEVAPGEVPGSYTVRGWNQVDSAWVFQFDSSTGIFSDGSDPAAGGGAGGGGTVGPGAGGFGDSVFGCVQEYYSGEETSERYETMTACYETAADRDSYGMAGSECWTAMLNGTIPPSGYNQCNADAPEAQYNVYGGIRWTGLYDAAWAETTGTAAEAAAWASYCQNDFTSYQDTTRAAEFRSMCAAATPWSFR